MIARAAAFGGQTNDKFAVPGTESQQAQDLLHEKFPGAGGASARVVFAAPEGEKLTDPENQGRREETVAGAGKADDVSGVIDPYKARALTQGRAHRLRRRDLPGARRRDRRRRRATSSPPAPSRRATAGLQVEFGGGLVTEEAEAGSESAGMMIGFLVLAITLGSLLAAGLPLLTALIGVGIGVAGVTALSGVDRGRPRPRRRSRRCSASPSASTTRCSSSRATARTSTRAWRRARRPRRPTATAGSAVVFAGLTVVIALVGLTVVNIPFLTVMGLAAAGTVAIAVLIAITLLPAHARLRRATRLARVNRVLGWRPRAVASRSARDR